jgi:hypothetical protein
LVLQLGDLDVTLKTPRRKRKPVTKFIKWLPDDDPRESKHVAILLHIKLKQIE